MKRRCSPRRSRNQKPSKPKRKLALRSSDASRRHGLKHLELKEPIDAHDVCEWFATDPAACVSNPAAQKILRAYEHPFKWWIKFPGRDEELSIRTTFEKAAQIHIQQKLTSAP